jgi:hypothetical protein
MSFLSNIQLARFLSKVAVPAYDSGCWEWQASKNNKGYGWFSHERKAQLAHRISYQHYHGPIPDGQEVMHVCDNPACVNPEHLKLGTHAQNMEDARRKGRSASGERVVTRRGEAHTKSKLTEEQVLAIRTDDRSDRQLAAEYGVAYSLIYRIRKGEVWQHV